MSLSRRNKTATHKADSIKEARQKRLQADGENLMKKINATISNTKVPENDLTFIANIKLDKDLKKYKYSLEAIELLFLNIKENMNEDGVTNKNITKLKSDIDRLETSINKLRESLKVEMLLLLKKTEEDFSDDHNNMDVYSESDNNVSGHTTKRGFNHEMNPNSVKNIVNCPFKSEEVQQYLNFMKSNKKHGGWNDVYHNKFIQLWNKNIGKIKDFNHDDVDVFESSTYTRFSKEIRMKIKGLTKEDLIEHSKWYLKYLYFRSRQQLAIDKYKQKKGSKNPPPLQEPPMMTESNVQPVKAVKTKVKLPPVTMSHTVKGIVVDDDSDSDWSKDDKWTNKIVSPTSVRN